MKKPYHTIRKQGKFNRKELATFLTKNGQGLLPMVDLITQCQMAGCRVPQVRIFGPGILPG